MLNHQKMSHFYFQIFFFVKRYKSSQIKFLGKLAHGVFWICHRTSIRALIRINMVIIASFTGAISVEINLFKSFFNILETVALVPTVWECIYRNLATNGKMKTNIRKLFIQGFNKGFSYISFTIDHSKIITVSLAYL